MNQGSNGSHVIGSAGPWRSREHDVGQGRDRWRCQSICRCNWPWWIVGHQRKCFLKMRHIHERHQYRCCMVISVICPHSWRSLVTLVVLWRCRRCAGRFSCYEAKLFRSRLSQKSWAQIVIKKEMRPEHLGTLLADLLEQKRVSDARPEEFTRYGSARTLYNFNIDNAVSILRVWIMNDKNDKNGAYLKQLPQQSATFS